MTWVVLVAKSGPSRTVLTGPTCVGLRVLPFRRLFSLGVTLMTQFVVVWPLKRIRIADLTRVLPVRD